MPRKGSHLAVEVARPKVEKDLRQRGDAAGRCSVSGAMQRAAMLCQMVMPIGRVSEGTGRRAHEGTERGTE